MTRETKNITLIASAYIAWLAVVVFVALYWLDAQAAVSTKSVPPSNPIFKTRYAEVVGVTSNGDGSSTVVIDACGTKVYVTADKEDIQLENPEIKNQAMEAINKACRP